MTLRMAQIGNEIVVAWTDGCIKQLIEGDQWQSFSPRQKQQWLQEMDCDRNKRSQVRLQLETQLAELFFQRSLGLPTGAAGATSFVAGKWVKLLHFQDVVAEAMKFI